MRWSIHYFDITDAALQKFMRDLPGPKDCVINAIQLLGIVDARTAALMRILINESGVQEHQIENIFKWVYPKYKWRFHEISITHKSKYLVLQHLQNIPTGTVVFGGVKWMDGSRHVILFGKSQNNTLVVLDPQAVHNQITIGMQNIINSYLALSSHIYFLESSAVQTRDIDVMDED